MERIRLMVIGVQKGGTTSLSHYLAEHPNVLDPFCVEFTFFTDDDEYKRGALSYWERFYPKEDAQGKLPVAKMSTLYCSLEGLERLRAHAPDCQLALVLRDPVSRAYSAYRMACFDGWLNFDPFWLQRLVEEGPGAGLFDMFIGYGYYAQHIDRLFSVFPREQVHLFKFEDLKQDPQKVCNVLFKAAGLMPFELKGKELVHNETMMARSSIVSQFIHWLRVERNPMKRVVRSMLPYDKYHKLTNSLIDLNRSKRQFPPMEPGVREALAAHYRDHDARLAQVLGWDLSKWTSQRS
ncbi:MAG: sulfotransferase domain-containing protein [Flavobacteriales bacterium]|nr:sulfotransferase domain-containing protein [Flavobacteriales bacterium]